MRRRDFLPAIALTAAAAQTPASSPRKRRLNQCVTRGVFAHDMSFEDTCKTASRLGLKGYDLEGPEQWPMLKKYGLTPTMWPPGPGGTISNALNRTENHAPLEKAMHAGARRRRGQRRPQYHRF